MNKRNLVFAFLATVAVIFLGFYFSWNSPEEPRSGMTRPEQTPSGSNTPRRVWKVNVDRKIERSLTDQSGPASDTLLEVPGRVDFAKRKNPDTVELEIRIMPFQLPLPSDLRNRVKNLPNDRSLNELLEQNKIKTEGLKLDRLVKESITMKITTGPDGKFKLIEAPPGLYKIRSIDQKWKGSSERIFLETPTHREKLSLSVRPAARFYGRVFDPRGNPIEGVEVRAHSANVRTRTDEDGQFVLENLNPGQAYDEIRLMHDRYGRKTISLPPVDAGQKQSDTFTLRPARKVVIKVRNPDGDPVKSGAVSVWKISHKNQNEEGDRAEPDLVHPLNEKGTVVFRGLPSGPIELKYQGGHYLHSRVRKHISGDGPSQFVLNVEAGKKLQIEYRDESTGRPVRGIQPVVYAFDGNRELLRPSFKLTGRGPNELKGLLHPETDEFLVYSRPRNLKKYYPMSTRHHSNELPHITIDLVPQPSPPTGKGKFTYYNVDLREPDNAREPFNWSPKTKSSFTILEKRSAQEYLTQGYRSRSFEDPIPIPVGSFYLFGSIERNGNHYVISESIQVTGSDRTRSKRIQPSKSASVTGKIKFEDTKWLRGLKVAYVPLKPETDYSASVGDWRVLQSSVPPPLITDVDPGAKFRLNYLPPGELLRLNVIVTPFEGSSRRGSGALILKQVKVGPLSPGEQNELGVINLQSN